MSKFSMRLCDGQRVSLPVIPGELLEARISDHRAQTGEMIDQINRRAYYEALFAGKQNLVFLDLGANLGLVSIYASPACQRIVAVEPEPATFETLLGLTQPFPNILCSQNALATASGRASLSVDPLDNSCHTVTNPKPGNPFKSVPALTFDDLVNFHELNHIDVCKVDVEGAEMACLSKETLKQAPVKSWYIEVHKTPEQPREKSMEQMVNRLQWGQYQVQTPRPNTIIATRS